MANTPRGRFTIDPLIHHPEARDDTTVLPPVDVYETTAAIVVVLEIAGADPGTIQVTREGNRITVVGERPEPTGQDKLRLYHMEIAYGRFERRVILPERLNLGEARAAYEHGFLRVTFEKEPERETDTRIPITGPR